MACVLLWSSGAAASLALLPRHPVLEKRKVIVGDWRLDVVGDRFSGKVACRLRAKDGHAIYRSGAIGFRFRSRWNVGQAVYRIDGGRPRVWRDDLPELVTSHAPVDAGGLDNPSAGVVWIPYRLLADANRVAIEARPDRRSRLFHFRGLKGLLATARERGCAPDVRFGP